MGEYIEEAKSKNETTLTGAQAFKLHDTYGFPLDLTVEMRRRQGLSVDIDGFNAEMDRQKKMAKEARKDGSSWDAEDSYSFEDINEATEFTGYTELESVSTIGGIVAVNEVSSEITDGENGIIVTYKTPFYAEMGGQSEIREVIEGKSVRQRFWIPKDRRRYIPPRGACNIGYI